MWYNESWKKEYLKDNIIIQRNQHLEKYIDNYFNLTYDWECRHGKDISNFTTNEIIILYKSLFTPSLEYLMVINSQLSNYTKFCMSKDLVTDHQNHFEEMSKEVLMTCVNTTLLDKKIVSYEQLMTVVNNQAQNAVDKYILLGLFYGLTPHELIDLRMNNFVENDVHIDDKIIPTNIQFKSLAEESINTFTYYIYNPKNIERGEYRLNEDDPSPIKVKEGFDVSGTDGAKYQRMAKKLITLQNDLGYQWFTYKKLRESGRIHTIKQLQKETDMSLIECLKNDKVTSVYGKVSGMERYILKYEKFLKN